MAPVSREARQARRSKSIHAQLEIGHFLNARRRPIWVALFSASGSDLTALRALSRSFQQFAYLDIWRIGKSALTVRGFRRSRKASRLPGFRIIGIPATDQALPNLLTNRSG